jgi:hypothetical protein
MYTLCRKVVFVAPEALCKKTKIIFRLFHTIVYFGKLKYYPNILYCRTEGVFSCSKIFCVCVCGHTHVLYIFCKIHEEHVNFWATKERLICGWKRKNSFSQNVSFSCSQNLSVFFNKTCVLYTMCICM